MSHSRQPQRSKLCGVGRREDVQQRIRVTQVEGLSVHDAALAEIALDNAVVGAANFTQVSVTERIAFNQGTLEGGMQFEKVESVGAVTLDSSTTRGPLRFIDCVFREDFTLVAATLAAPLMLTDCVFDGNMSLDGVTATELVVIEQSKIGSEMSLNAGTYSDVLKLSKLEAEAAVRLVEAALSGPLLIEDSTFTGPVSLDGLRSTAPVEVRDVNFEGAVSFHSGYYADTVLFHNVEFQREVTFDSAMFSSRVVFRDVRFLGPVSFRRANFRGVLRFEHVRFDSAVDFDIGVNRLELVNTTLAVQASLVLGHAEVIIESSRFAAPVTIDSGSTSRVRSLAGTDATNLTLAEVDLGGCGLSDVYNLDKLRVEAAAFPEAPHRLRFSRQWPWVLKRSKRRIVIEEAVVRTRSTHSADWVTLLEGYTAPKRPVYANDVARVYRQLRKAREDAKDEPNAADFYYGEMEMRRRATPRLSAEGLILRLYWLTSGYGLRGLRSVACLVMLLLICATLMNRFGFADQHSWTASLVYVADAGTKLVGTSSSDRLTGWGVALQVLVRLASPVLLGLAILSVRGRTKR